MNTPWYDPNIMSYLYNAYLYNYYNRNQMYYNNCGNYDSRIRSLHNEHDKKELRDYGPEPFAIDINQATIDNNNFRTALWTGDHLQLTLMSLNPGEEIGLEMHPDIDQFIRIEQGQGLVKMGDSGNNLNFQENVSDDFIFIVPAGKYHNLINTGQTPLKLYSIYAPPQHPHGTVHKTKKDALEAEKHNEH